MDVVSFCLCADERCPDNSGNPSSRFIATLTDSLYQNYWAIDKMNGFAFAEHAIFEYWSVEVI
jgi:hypothetical protein